MFFKKKRKHTLPKFPKHVIPTYQALCNTLSEKDFMTVVAEANHHFAEQQRNASDDVSNYNEKDAQALRECINFFAKIYAQRSPKEQSLIAGAVAYATHADDAFCDHTFASGLTDDIRIFNYVLEELDIHDRYLYLY